LTGSGVKISMDGRGRYLDNIFIERLWRSLKQEAVYLHKLQDGFQANRVIKDWIGFYNSERPHTALDKRSPNDAFFDIQQTHKAA
jgi:putative transposase